MEGNTCDINHLDSDVLLPPRKRLLAGLKKQNFDDDNPCSPSSSTDDITDFEFDIRLNNLLKFHSDDCRSIEEIVEASRVAALKAVELAKAARAVAEEKAAKASEAMAAAKSAMELVATVSGEVTDRDKYSKNKNKYKGIKNCTTDEDLARTLSRTINSSPRISKNSTSDSRNQKHKRLKRSSPAENAKLQNGSTSWEANRPSTSNGIDITGNKASNGPSQEKELIRVDLSVAKFNKADLRKMENGKGEPINSKEEFGESPNDICNVDKKKGRMKQKTLPLSNCSLRDKVNPKRT